MALARVQQGQSPFGTQAIPAVIPGITAVDTAAQLPVAGPVAAKVGTDRSAIDLHTRLVEMFEASEDSSKKARERSERDVDYFDNKQWTAKDAAEVEARGQAAIVKNRIRQKVKYLQGLEQQQRTDPRALPRTPKHDFDANDCTDALRFVVGSNRYDQLRSEAWWDLVVAGWGGFSVTVEFKPPMANPRIIIKRCRWDRMFWDPFSSERNYSDASYLGEVLWMDRDDAVRKYGEAAAKVFDETVSIAQTGGTFDDKPRVTTWVAYDKRYRVRVVKMYYIGDDGQWQFCEFTKGGYLKSAVSPWMDDDGKPEHEYAWRSAYVDRDNNRYGDIRDLIDTQDEINKRSSKLLHFASVRQTFATEGALGDTSTKDLQKELAKPSGHVALAPGMEFGKQFGIIPTGDMAQYQAEILQQNLAEMEQQGPNAAMLGNASRDASGRAVLANQAGGALASSPLFDIAKDMDHEVYRKVWRRVRQYWRAEEWVRVTDDTNTVRWVGLNTPAMQEALDPVTGQPVQMPVIDPMTGQPKMQNNVADLDIDIEIDDAPHVGTMQQEEFAKLAELGNTPLGALPIYPKLLIKASSFRSKAEMLKALDEMEKSPPKPDPEMVKADTALKLEQAKIEGQLHLKQAELQMQSEAKQAETQGQLRMKAGELEMKEREQMMQLQFDAQKHAQELQFMREKFELEQATRAQAARDAHVNAQRQHETRQ